MVCCDVCYELESCVLIEGDPTPSLFFVGPKSEGGQPKFIKHTHNMSNLNDVDVTITGDPVTIIEDSIVSMRIQDEIETARTKIREIKNRLHNLLQNAKPQVSHLNETEKQSLQELFNINSVADKAMNIFIAETHVPGETLETWVETWINKTKYLIAYIFNIIQDVSQFQKIVTQILELIEPIETTLIAINIMFKRRRCRFHVSKKVSFQQQHRLLNLPMSLSQTENCEVGGP